MLSEFKNTDNTNEESDTLFRTNSLDQGFGNIALINTQNIERDTDSAIIELKRICDLKNLSFNYFVLYISLIDDGALQVPLVFNAGHKAFSVFFIYSEEDAKKYLDALDKLGETEYPNAIYFSAIEIGQVTKKIICTRTLKLADLKFNARAVISGEYAMWWPDESEDIFWDSPTSKILQNTYEVFRNYESVHAGYLLNQIGLAAEIGRAWLPDEDKALPVIGPEQKNLLVVLSKEKGIRFFFPVNTTSRFYREQFLYAMNIDFLTYRLSLQQQEIEKEKRSEHDSYVWFNSERELTTEKEKQGIKILGFCNTNVLIF